MVRLTNYMIINQTRLTPRPKDKKDLINAFDALPEEEIIASETLTKILQTRRMKANKSRDFSSEPPSVAGVMSLHTTAWDWLSPTLKNAVRDIDPCMRAITVERLYVRTYRPRMLEDAFIGTLRRLLEETLTLGVKEVTTIDSHGLLSNKRAWLWWDGLVLNPAQEAPAVVLEGIKDDVIKEQRQQQDRLVMENADREAIQKLVAYVSNMACALSASPATMLSADVTIPLEELITVSSCPPWLHFTWADLYAMLAQGPPSPYVTWADLPVLHMVRHGSMWHGRTYALDGVVRRRSLCMWSAMATYDMRGPIRPFI